MVNVYQLLGFKELPNSW